MRFSADREAVKIALAAALKVAPSNRATIPILGCVLIDASDGLAITANDLDQSVTISAVGQIEQPGRVAVDAQRFAGAVLSLPEGADFSFDLPEGEGRATLKSGRSRFLIPTLPAQDFPTFPVGRSEAPFDLSCATLARLLALGAAYTRKDATLRAGADMAHLHRIGDKLRMVSTDQHRIIWCETPADTAPVGMLPEEGLCLPEKSVKTLAALIPDEGTATIGATANLLTVNCGAVVYGTKLGGGGWLDYARAVPRAFAHTLFADIDLLSGALARSAVMADEKIRGVRLDGKPGSLAFSSRNEQTGQANDEIDVDYEGEPFSMFFDVDYLIDAVGRVTGENVKIAFNIADRAQPISIGETRESDWFLLVMSKSP